MGVSGGRIAQEQGSFNRRRDVAYIYLDCMVNEAVTVLARRALEQKVDPRPIIQRLRREIPAEMVDWTGPDDRRSRIRNAEGLDLASTRVCPSKERP
ncbi:MAG: hypothetical protein HY347_10930 [candidate division NC10 bacterium]|nr:hypothetical protein [candidate division NC10 bacterium]